MLFIKKRIALLPLLFILINVSVAFAENSGNLTQLNHEIQSSSDSLNLKKDYSGHGKEKIKISKSIEINGNKNTISTDSPIVFDNSKSDLNVELRNITFRCKNDLFGGISDSRHSLNLTFTDSKFIISPKLKSGVSISFYYKGKSTTGSIPDVLKVYAKGIVGDSTGVSAAKKLAKWVGKNIKHETKVGFYQSPIMTLIRGKGNCACQADLFLQMCKAVGVDKYCKMYYVHVGNYKFGERHFFAMIDDIPVDVDGRPNYPWGHASMKRNITKIVEYPYLPIERTYTNI